MAYFFYGTLRDPDVLALVLNRDLTDRDHLAAWLPEHRIVRAAEEPYPVLVPTPGAVAEGTALLSPSRRDECRINWFEEDEYWPSWQTIRIGQAAARARVFLPLEGLRASDAPWDYPRWRSEEKPGFLERCAEWLRELDPP